jgi:hypothetical protein
MMIGITAPHRALPALGAVSARLVWLPEVDCSHITLAQLKVMPAIEKGTGAPQPSD